MEYLTLADLLHCKFDAGSLIHVTAAARVRSL